MENFKSKNRWHIGTMDTTYSADAKRSGEFFRMRAKLATFEVFASGVGLAGLIELFTVDLI